MTTVDEIAAALSARGVHVLSESERAAGGVLIDARIVGEKTSARTGNVLFVVISVVELPSERGVRRHTRITLAMRGETFRRTFVFRPAELQEALPILLEAEALLARRLR